MKFFARSVLERLNRVISAEEYGHRLNDLFKSQWHHVDELMDFDEANKIPSTFFFSMSKGKGLNYSQGTVGPVIQRVIQRGFDCGVHGISFDNPVTMEAEFQRFRTLSGKSDFGIRMHYLRRNEGTSEILANCGYQFDTTEFAAKAPYRIGNMWEFPLSIMDSDEFYQGNSTQKEKIGVIIGDTKSRIDKFAGEGIPYLVLLFHDRYYCNAFQSYREWYETIVNYFRENGCPFIGYREAIKELSQQEQA